MHECLPLSLSLSLSLFLYPWFDLQTSYDQNIPKADIMHGGMSPTIYLPLPQIRKSWSHRCFGPVRPWSKVFQVTESWRFGSLVVKVQRCWWKVMFRHGGTFRWKEPYKNCFQNKRKRLVWMPNVFTRNFKSLPWHPPTVGGQPVDSWKSASFETCFLHVVIFSKWILISLHFPLWVKTGESQVKSVQEQPILQSIDCGV